MRIESWPDQIHFDHEHDHNQIGKFGTLAIICIFELPLERVTNKLVLKVAFFSCVETILVLEFSPFKLSVNHLLCALTPRLHLHPFK